MQSKSLEETLGGSRRPLEESPSSGPETAGSSVYIPTPFLHSRPGMTVSPTPCSGQLSLNEFVEGARRDKWVMKMLQMDLNPSSWISQQRRKSAMF